MQTLRDALNVVFVVGTCFLTACAASLDRDRRQEIVAHKATLGNSAVCCNSYRQFSFQNLLQGNEAVVPISDDTPVFQFTTGRSHFVAFRLPAAQGAQVLTIKTWFTGGSSLLSMHVFRPSLDFLDSNLRPILSLPNLTFTHPMDFCCSRLQAEVPVPRDASFVVVYSITQRPGGDAWTKKLEGVAAPLIAGDSEVSVPFSPVGKLGLDLHPAS